ncbi:flagella basal body P-ring formation protein FlgA [Candidatus Thiodiazotropha endoloripes]|uniref:flagellar basal body P-ring formation chaperone FlgA n=1 Tax=Candidatus Thiodiazotropha endoloripes TaxID=1818881 RepID=UPI00083CF9A6|nr:flagellar basal body P-ring formation chaperone FlgA [Candidatus Thiodiazotropha endoloripes]ODB85645.1 flagella basal body P-ring formation protein FlgA [Candidatus Thiodiazotropha endoloripes]
MKSILLHLFAGLIFVGMSNTGYANNNLLTIELPSNVNLDSRTITLHDIAKINGDNQALINKLSRIALGILPRAGVRLTIDREAISERLQRVDSDIDSHLVWKGSNKVTISSNYKFYKNERYTLKAENYLKQSLSIRYSDVTTKLVGQYKDIQLPSGKVSLNIGIRNKHRISKRMCVWVDVEVDNKHYTSIPVWFDVTAMDEVLELITAQSASTPLEDHMLKPSIRNIALVTGIPLSEFSSVVSHRLVRDLPKGAVITRSVIEVVPDVVKGQKVRIQASVGRVTLYAIARALQDGNRGDSIRVERLDGKESYLAKVLDSGLAIVGDDFK